MKKEEEDGDVGSSSIESSNNAFHKSLPLSTRILSREEILQNEQGYQNNLVLLMLDRKKNQWVPVLPDYMEAFHCMGGIVASGYPLRVQKNFRNTTNSTTQDDGLAVFRLEIPQPGNMSRVFLRHFQRRKENNNNNVDGDDDDDDDHDKVNPSYRQAPFLMFINNCLCVRAVPPHAVLNISRKSATSPDNKISWERLELRAPFSSFYTQGMSNAEHQAAFLLCGGDHRKEIHWDEDNQRFVLMYKKVRKKLVSKDNNKNSQSKKIETSSSDEFHTYEQRTWFVLARIDGSGDDDGDDKKSNEKSNETKDQSLAMEKADSDSVSTWKSTASSIIEKYLAQFFFLFGFLLSKLGIIKSTTDNLVTNEEKKGGAGGGDGMGRVPDVGNAQVLCSSKENVVESPFVFRESRVVDQDTGESLSASTVVRGTVRCETLVFEIKTTELVNLTRSIVTMKSVGFGYINVGMDSIELGTFKAGPNQCDLPPQEVPSTSLAKGSYKVHITYTAENVQDKVLREETVEFKIV